ncbi:HD domain-containing phosphohydrolase [Fluviispira vulneris]|uniref:HD domain-containing phosphohydrolase n=1 Tax=Fluviispira vulneris TaxID=2763012 RepID=UPI00257110CF|nr:HD domain-containing phosphohydrolase [Fluviispira vulneris]
MSPFEKIDVFFIYKPFDIHIPINDLNQLKINFITSSLNEAFSAKKLDSENLKLFVLTLKQFNDYHTQIKSFLRHGANAKHSGFFILESNNLIIKERKSNNKNKNKVENILCELSGSINKNQFTQELKNSIYSLFIYASSDFLSSFSILRDIESNALKEISQAMTSKSFLAGDFLNLVLKKSMKISAADSGFIIIKKGLFDEKNDIRDSNKLNLIKNQKFILKYKINNSQKISLKKEIFDPKKSKITKIICDEMVGVSWHEESKLIVSKNKKVQSASNQLSELIFDPKTYKIKSYCVFPIRLPSSEVDGFILLINKKISDEIILDKRTDIDNSVIPFPSHDLNLLESLTNQAGIALEHAKLIHDLKQVFESFTAASIIAIESRDPSTKGHSERVATLTVGLADAINQTQTGLYGNLQFSKIQIEEIKYASLLHDFGKIGVREHILQKEKKLFPYELERIQIRFASIQDRMYANILESYINSLMIKNQAPSENEIAKIKLEVKKVSEKLENYWKIILDVNEPAVLSEETFEKIAEIAGTQIIIGDSPVPLLTPHEINLLSIKRGSLSQQERLEIESHVTHSFNFLVKIPWSKELKDLPEIVYGHHERLDGSGYPRKLKSKDIPVQAKMMAITDIFDALVARDRPYKKAIPYDRALNILESEVKLGKLDAALFKIFVEAKVGELTLEASIDERSTSVA